MCVDKHCKSNRKSIRKERVEQQFEDILARATPSMEVLAVAREMLKELWEARTSQSKKAIESFSKELDSKQRAREKILDRIVECDDADLTKSYEGRLSRIKQEERNLEEVLHSLDNPIADFDEMFEPAMQFLSSPYKIWKKNDYAWQRALLRVFFSKKIKCCQKEGLRTAEFSFAFKALSRPEKVRDGLVEHSGIEPLSQSSRRAAARQSAHVRKAWIAA